MQRQAIVQKTVNHRTLSENRSLRNKRVSTEFLTAAIISAFVLFSAILAQSFDSVAHASEGNGYKATYIVEFKGIELGVSERTVVAGDDLMATSTHVLEPQGLAAMLGESRYVDITKMDLSDSRIRTISSQRQGEKSSDSYTAEFEWNDRTIRFSSGNSIAMPNQDVYDFESWIMLLTLYPDQHQVGSALSILERENRLRSYRVVQNDNDVIDVKGEMIDTRRIRLQDTQDDSRGFTVWIVPEFHNLVLKLIKHKESTELKFTIEEFRQIIAEES